MSGDTAPRPGVDGLLVSSLFLGWVAFAIVPLNFALALTDNSGTDHASTHLCMALAVLQIVTAGAAAVAMAMKMTRLRGAPRRVGAVLLLCWYCALAVAGLVGLGLIYVVSLDTTGVGARFN